MTLQPLRLAWHNLLRNRRRSAVTLAIVMLGSAGLLLAGGFAIYTYQGLAQQSARSTGHLVAAQRLQFDGDEDVPLQHGIDDATALARRLTADDAVRQVLPRVEFTGLISNGDKSTVMTAAGIDPDAEFAIKGPFLTLRAGRVLSSSDRRQVMLGEGLARSLKATPGSGLTLLASTTAGALNALDVAVAGVVSTGIPELDRRLVYTDIATAQQLLATSRLSSLGVYLSSMEATGPARQRLQALLPGLELRSWEQLSPFYRAVRELYNRIFGALGLIIATIVAFVVTNAMAMAVIERTREIGTLRAIGTLPGQLVRGFALEGLLLGATGTLAGMALSLAVSGLLLAFPVQMPPPPGRSVGYPLQIAADPALYAFTLAVMLVLAAVASAAVARRAVRTPIVEALAHV